MQKADFQYYQFHFPLDLDIEIIRQWSEMVGPSNLWLAPKLPPGADFPDHLLQYAETFVIDAYSQDKFGGTGKSADWKSFSEFQILYPEKKWILAGGIGPENVVSSVIQTDARMIDLNSAVESKPGQKEVDKIKSVFESLKENCL
jgi:phosphoribosylanthranilate isomerase